MSKSSTTLVSMVSYWTKVVILFLRWSRILISRLIFDKRLEHTNISPMEVKKAIAQAWSLQPSVRMHPFSQNYRGILPSSYFFDCLKLYNILIKTNTMLKNTPSFYIQWELMILYTIILWINDLSISCNSPAWSQNCYG